VITGLGISARVRQPYADALASAVDALKVEGFGVLTEIDVRATLKKKLDVDFRPYMILGACNPPLAHKALSANLDVGLLLPCNVIVYQDGDETVVTAVDPVAMLGVMKDDPVAAEVATDAKARLLRVMARLNG
jgi:uncharacterized protein (DUF302 family)